MPEEPYVSALMAAYNAEPFVAEAIESALAQDWPADRLEVVVVDDGSTDGTAAVVASYVERHPGRVRLIRQANAGPCGAVNAALAAARGEWLGLLDADDVWPRDKLRVQGDVLKARPEVGLVYGDMRVIDEHGDVIQESWLEGEPVIPEGRCTAELLAGNPATASSLLMRAEVVEPIPDGIPYTDWWFAARAALVSDVAYVAEPRTFYRFHGGNITLGVKGANRVRELRKALTFVRWFLRRMEPGMATARGLAIAWTFFEHCERELAALGEAGVEVTDADRAAARVELARVAAANGGGPATAGRAPAGNGGAPATAGRASAGNGGAPAHAAGAAPLLDGGHHATAFVRASAADPTSSAARDGLAVALAAALPADAAPLDGAGPRVALAYADELVADPGLLAAWTRELRGVPGVTLAVVTPPATTDALAHAAADLPDDVDVLAIVGHVGREAVSAVFSERGHNEPPAPRFGAAGLARLAAAWS